MSIPIELEDLNQRLYATDCGDLRNSKEKATGYGSRASA
jgi:hypothetical protein